MLHDEVATTDSSKRNVVISHLHSHSVEAVPQDRKGESYKLFIERIERIERRPGRHP